MNEVDHDDIMEQCWNSSPEERQILSIFQPILVSHPNQDSQPRNSIFSRPYELEETPEASVDLRKGQEDIEDSPKTTTATKKQKGKTNNYPTKNMLQYFMKALRNRYKDSQNQAIAAELKRMNFDQMKANLTTMRKMFCNEVLRVDLMEMFESEWLCRAIVMSGIALKRKLEYLKRVPALREGFRKKKLEFLN